MSWKNCIKVDNMQFLIVGLWRNRMQAISHGVQIWIMANHVWSRSVCWWVSTLMLFSSLCIPPNLIFTHFFFFSSLQFQFQKSHFLRLLQDITNFLYRITIWRVCFICIWKSLKIRLILRIYDCATSLSVCWPE